jgi:hypothetical protein
MLKSSRVAALLIAVVNILAFSGAHAQSNVSALAAFDGMVAKVLTMQDGPQVNVAWVNMAVERPDARTVSFKGRPFIQTATHSIAISLKTGASPDSYAFSLTSSAGPSVEDLPLRYSDTNGFAGAGKVQTDRGEWEVAVTIKKRDAGGFEWQALFTREASKGRFEYGFRTEPKEAGK